MLKKLEELNNYNKFINIKSCNTKWDYNFKHNNIIYARNGYGKISLSILFESMKNNNSLEQKKFFGTCENILVKFVDDCGKEIIYNKDWINQIKEIEVFNSFYIEDNTYLINIKNNFIEEICDEPNEAIIYKNKIKEEQEKLKKFTIKKRNRKQNIRKRNTLLNKKELNENYYKDELLQKCEKNIIDIKTTIVNDKNKYFTLIMSGIKKYFLSINKYLHLFCDAVEITTPKIVNNGEKIKLIYGISINGYEIKSKDREENKTHPLKYSLSEGDKNALSLSFFLAKLDLLNDIDKYIIVIDDPLTSFDTFRKNTTIRQLVGISKKVNQVFLFTHDLNFAKELCDNLNKDETQLLEIKQANSGNYIDIGNGDNLYLNITSYFNVLNSFSYNPSSYNDLIVVGRNIRPCIEGIIKIKYSDVIESNFLLGQIIDKIRNSSEKSPLNKLKNYVEELDDIRCYSNHFHHDKGLDAGFTIEPDELLKYVNRTINLYRSI